MKIAIGIATAGRSEILSETLKELAKQTRLPDLVVVCPADNDDVRYSEISQLPFNIKIVSGKKGSSSQRNAIIRFLTGYDVAVFFDDDFFPLQNYIANVEILLSRHPEVVVATGKLIADGAQGPGINPDCARTKLSKYIQRTNAASLQKYYGAYGCNMVVRLEPVREREVVFDESLPLYAWQEDIDFSRQLAPFGEIVCSDLLCGVHLGTKKGRTSGVRFGYSQIANPVYLIRKGTMSFRFGARTMSRNIIANFVRLFKPEPYIDRKGRCRGNILAFVDLLSGRLHPSRILQID